MTFTSIAVLPPLPAEALKSIQQARDEMLQEREYEIYLTTYDSHVRLDALVEILPRLNDREYWTLLRDVWISSEVTLPDKDKWLSLLRAKRPERDRLMVPSDRRFLARLPDVVTIYRGCGHVDGIYGLSWTLDYERARFFAVYACGPRRRVLSPQYHGTTPTIAKATCPKNDVLSYFSRRNEAEIVVDPTKIHLIDAREWRSSR
ncbi:MAG TPA: hypothetical protein VG734_17945 [Lacunisphaera sp.]|nr:hypothetical protein [Lacunisphaera sp.]